MHFFHFQTRANSTDYFCSVCPSDMSARWASHAINCERHWSNIRLQRQIQGCTVIQTTLYLFRFPEGCFCFDFVLYTISYTRPALHNQNKQRFLNETFKTRCVTISKRFKLPHMLKFKEKTPFAGNNLRFLWNNLYRKLFKKIKLICYIYDIYICIYYIFIHPSIHQAFTHSLILNRKRRV